MTAPSELHQRVYARFREVFGNPSSALDRDDHWSLKPHPAAVAINVLVNGSALKPAVWIFDPHSVNDGVMRTAVDNEDRIDAVIAQIQDRLRAAAQRFQSPDGLHAPR